MIDPLPSSGPGPWRLRATVAWLICLVAAAMALDVLVLAVEIGPFDPAVAVTIAVSALSSAGAAVAFWRLVARRGGHPRLAAALVFVAVVWAGLGALVLAWLIAAFSP